MKRRESSILYIIEGIKVQYEHEFAFTVKKGIKRQSSFFQLSGYRAGEGFIPLLEHGMKFLLLLDQRAWIVGTLYLATDGADSDSSSTSSFSSSSSSFFFKHRCETCQQTLGIIRHLRISLPPHFTYVRHSIKYQFPN